MSLNFPLFLSSHGIAHCSEFQGYTQLSREWTEAPQCFIDIQERMLKMQGSISQNAGIATTKGCTSSTVRTNSQFYVKRLILPCHSSRILATLQNLYIGPVGTVLTLHMNYLGLIPDAPCGPPVLPGTILAHRARNQHQTQMGVSKKQKWGDVCIDRWG